MRRATERESRARFWHLLSDPQWAALGRIFYDVRLRCGHTVQVNSDFYVLLGEQVRCTACGRLTTVVNVQGLGDLPKRRPADNASSDPTTEESG